MLLVVVVLGHCRFDILLAVALFAVAVSLNFSEPSKDESEASAGSTQLREKLFGQFTDCNRTCY